MGYRPAFIFYLVLFADGGFQKLLSARVQSEKVDNSKEGTHDTLSSAADQEATSMLAARRSELMRETSEAGVQLQRSTLALAELLQGPEMAQLTTMLERGASGDVNDSKKMGEIVHAVIQQVENMQAKDVIVRRNMKELQQPLIASGEGELHVDFPDVLSSEDLSMRVDDAFKPVGKLVKGISAVASNPKLIKESSSNKLLKLADSRLAEHADGIERLIVAAEDTNEQAKSLGSTNNVAVLDDSRTSEDVTDGLVNDLAVIDVDSETVSTEIKEIDLDRMDGFTRIQLCQYLDGVNCESCDAAAESLEDYRTCVQTAISKRIHDLQHEKDKKKQQEMLRKTVELRKQVKDARREAVLYAFDALQVYGVYRNWARWNENPMWPLQALKGEPAKEGWANFTGDSESILNQHKDEFIAESTAIAEEEGSASAQWAYDNHAAEHVNEAQAIQGDAQQLQGDLTSMQGRAQTTMADAQANMEKAQQLQQDGVALQEKMATTRQDLEAQIDYCSSNDLESRARCDPAEMERLRGEMKSHEAEARDLQVRGEELRQDSAAMQQDMQDLQADGEQIQRDGEELAERTEALKVNVEAELMDPETQEALKKEAVDCVKRIASRVGDAAAHHAKQAALEILALVPDLLLAACEAALDIITGFGWIITAFRVLYKLTTYSHRKWKEWRDSREQKLCKYPVQLDCCVDAAMHMYGVQILQRRTSEPEFMAATRVSLPQKILKERGTCAPWTVSLLTPPSEDEAAVLERLARDTSEAGVLEFQTNVVVTGMTGRYRYPRRVLVSSGVLIVEDTKEAEAVRNKMKAAIEKATQGGKKKAVAKDSQNYIRQLSSSCTMFLPDASRKYGLRVEANKDYAGSFKFVFEEQLDHTKHEKMTSSRRVKFEVPTTSAHEGWLSKDEESQLNICAIAGSLCRASCSDSSICDGAIDEDVFVDPKPQLKLAKKARSRNLLVMCARNLTAQLLSSSTTTTSLAKSAAPEVGPAALRVLVWHQLLNNGREPVSAAEARARSVGICEKYVMPSWRCGAEECAICEGVASIYQSSQKPMRWCNNFKEGDIEDYSLLDKPTAARDFGRYFKCSAISKYFASTEDKSRLNSRQATVRDACSSRDLCKTETALLPEANLLPKYAGESDTKCRLCVEFVQRAAGGLKPQGFCDAISRKLYPQQKDECNKLRVQMEDAWPEILEEASENYVGSDDANEEPTVRIRSCDKFCESWWNATGKSNYPGAMHKSPLLIAGTHAGMPPPGPKPDSAPDDTGSIVDQSSWLRRARSAIWGAMTGTANWLMRKPVSPLRNTGQAQEILGRGINKWRALLKQINWDGTFTQKRVWPRTNSHGLLTQKLEEATYFMTQEGQGFIRHIAFVEDLYNTKVEMPLAAKTLSELVSRMEGVINQLEAMPEALELIGEPSSAGGLRREQQRAAKDAKSVGNCYHVLVERYETYGPLLKAIGEDLKKVSAAVFDARAKGLVYTAKSIGLLNVIAKLYLILPKREQSRWTRIKQRLNPLNLFRVRLQIDKLSAEDDDKCSMKRQRRFFKSSETDRVAFQACCASRAAQLLGWEASVMETHMKLNKILELMDYVKGNFITRNIRRGLTSMGNGIAGRRKYKGHWVQDEAADLLKSISETFEAARNKDEQANIVHGAEHERHKERLMTQVGDKQVWRKLSRVSRFQYLKKEVASEIRKGKKVFENAFEKLQDVAKRISTKPPLSCALP